MGTIKSVSDVSIGMCRGGDFVFDNLDRYIDSTFNDEVVEEMRLEKEKQLKRIREV